MENGREEMLFLPSPFFPQFASRFQPQNAAAGSLDLCAAAPPAAAAPGRLVDRLSLLFERTLWRCELLGSLDLGSQ